MRERLVCFPLEAFLLESQMTVQSSDYLVTNRLQIEKLVNWFFQATGDSQLEAQAPCRPGEVFATGRNTADTPGAGEGQALGKPFRLPTVLNFPSRAFPIAGCLKGKF